MSVDLLHDETGEKPRRVPQLADHPWRMAFCVIAAGIFLAMGLTAPQLPNLFPHVRLGWLLACSLLAISSMGIASSRMPIRLTSAALGTAVTWGMCQYFVQYDLIGDVMAYRADHSDLVWQETIVGMLVFAPLVVLHVSRIESHLETTPLRFHAWDGARMGLLQSGWLTLIVMALLFAGPILAPIDSPDMPPSLTTPWENPWFVVAVGGSLLVAGTLSGAIAALAGSRVMVGVPDGVVGK